MPLMPDFHIVQRFPGLGARIFLAFSVTSLLVVVAAIIGGLGYAEIARKQRLMINEALPGMIKAQTLAETNAHIVASAPSLATSRSDQNRQQLYTQLTNHTSALDAMVLGMRNNGLELSRMTQLQTIVNKITTNLARQNKQVIAKHKAEQRLIKITERIRVAGAELSDISGSLVANAATTTTAVIATLYDLSESPAERPALFDAFDRLVEVDVDSLERMFELQLTIADLSAYVNQLVNETELTTIHQLQHQYGLSLTTLGRRIRNINDPGRQAQAETLLQALNPADQLQPTSDLFQLRRTELSTAAALQRLDERNRLLGTDLNRSVAQLVREATTSINSATAAAESAVQRGRLFFAASAFVSVMVVGLILWLYIHRTVVRRITTLDTTMRALAEGDYTVEVNSAGGDELAKMATTIQVFKRSALEKLALERERERISQELQQYQRSLEKLVEQRTTELRDANVQLAEEASNHDEARRLAEQANNAKTTFLATMSHEIRTPMSGILGSLQLLRDNPLSSAQTTIVDLVIASCTSLLSILNDILDYAKIEAGGQRLEKSDFNVHALVAEMVSLMRPAANGKGLQLTGQSARDVPQWVCGAPGQLRQILLNLIGNAIKFTDQGSISVNVSQIACNESTGCMLRFDVIDDGIGVPPGMHEAVFDAFTQVDTSLARRHGGAGLGLSICKRLVDAMGGSIGLDNKPRNGTRAWVVLPFNPVSAPVEACRKPSLPASRHSSTSRSWRVLLVDDDEVNRRVAEAFLKSLGCHVTSAHSGQQALAMLEQEDVDVLLLDISMPEMDGLEVTRRIRSSRHQQLTTLPIIAMSAHVFSEEIDQFLAAGMDGFVSKPTDPDSLEQCLDAVLQPASARRPWSSITSPPTFPASTSVDHGQTLFDNRILQRDLQVLGTDEVVNLITLYLSSSDTTMAEIKDAGTRQCWEDVNSLAHCLKSAAASVGLVALQNLMQEIEQATDGIPDGSITDMITELDSLHARSCSALTSYRRTL